MLRRARLGMAMFLLNEAVFFLFLIIGFVYFHKPETKMTGVSFEAVALYTACLLASSFMMWRAAVSAQQHSAPAVSFWLAGAILLGAAFLLGQWGEYRSAEPSRELASAFFILTGCHELHVAVGILLLGSTFLVQAGEFRSVAVQTVALYWYFVTAVWIAIFSIVYLWAFL